MNDQNQPQALDQDVVNFAKAVRQTESGGNFQAQGKSGEYGAYQFTQPTWNTLSKKYGVNVPLQQATPEQQNEVAYKQFKDWKDQGYNPGQMASMWNAGESEPNAYQGTFSDGQSSAGTNKYGVKFDVPAYAESVAKAYHAIKNGGNVGIDPNNPSSIASQNQNKEGFLSSLLSSVTDPISQLGGSIAGKISDLTGGFLNKNLPVVNQNQQVTGITGNAVDTFGYRNGQALNTEDTAKQVAGNLLENAATFGLGGIGEVGEATGLAAKALRGAKVGASIGGLQGAGSSLSQGDSLSDTALSGLAGATGGLLTGGVLGSAGALLSSLPTRLVQGAFGNISPDVANYALQNKSLGTISGMLQDSRNAMSEIGNKVTTILTSPENIGKSVLGQDIYNAAIQGNPSIPGSGLQKSGYTIEKLANLTKGLVKNYGASVDKLFTEGLSLQDANELKTALGKATFQTPLGKKILGPNQTKQAGRQVYFALSNAIEKAAPETVPLFDQFEKEIPLANALTTMQQKGGILGGKVTLKELIAGMTAASAGFPGIAAIAGYHALNSPLGSFATGKLLGGTSRLVGNKAYTAAGLVGKSLQSTTKTQNTTPNQ